MKKGIHPDYKETTISCACGEVIHTRSTKPNIKVDICSKCHPFFTGKQKLVDSAGMVDKFKKRYEKTVETKKRAKTATLKPSPEENKTDEAAQQKQS
ncbi:MAG: 50S ribosomal protein L31 [Candidatus Omnitrophica bacterium]|nr:50S ribosomal protein L31 [Candidatus Omnitrophota bacterium]